MKIIHLYDNGRCWAYDKDGVSVQTIIRKDRIAGRYGDIKAILEAWYPGYVVKAKSQGIWPVKTPSSEAWGRAGDESHYIGIGSAGF